MGVYIAPEIKDRVAVGDDLYQITDSGGKKKLTPSPTEVAEPGTEINKALLQPMADALQKASADLVPYNDFWWRIRQNAGTYSVRLAPAAQIDEAVSSFVHNNGTKYYQVNFFVRTRGSGESYETYTRTYKVASSITISSSGVISLVNPTTYTSTSDDSNLNSTLQSRCAGKYVQGLLPDTSRIYKISSNATVEDSNFSWTVSGETSYENDIGYKWTSATSTYVAIAVADYSATASDFSYVSNEDENFYPHTGTQDGIEYQYLGKIFDVAVKAEPYGIKTVNITSASWNDRKYSIDIPCSRYLLWAGDQKQGKRTTFGSWLLVDNQKIYGAVKNYYSSNIDYYTDFYTGFTPGTNSSNAVYITANIGIIFTDTGIQLWYGSSVSETPVGVLAYLPL